MRSRPALVAAGLLLAAAAEAETDGFVVAGQSNAVGWSTQYADERTARVTSPSASGLASWSFRLADHAWTLANEFPCDDAQCLGADCATRTAATHPSAACTCDCGVHVSSVGTDTGRGSAWPTFAERWMQERGREVRFVAAAVGGKCLVGAPDPSQPAWDPDAYDCATLPPVPIGVAPSPTTAPGELYCRMLEAVRLADLANLRAVLWFQGECDVVEPVAPAAYQAAVEHLADRIAADLDVPLVVAPITRKLRAGDACQTNPRIDSIHDAIVAAAAAHPNVWLGPDADDLALEADCRHVHDVRSLGRRWYEAAIASLPACWDGRDNDADGLVDFPADPDCPTRHDTGELGGPCSNGVDDDGDGAADFPADPGCVQPSDASEHSGARCDDGFDDDGDGAVDFPADPGCADTALASTEATACDDGLDNDGDGKIDWDGGGGGATADPTCAGDPRKDGEGRRSCGLGAEAALALAVLRRRAARAGSAAARSARRDRTRPRADTPTG
jgi:hypothetical protein